MFTIEFIYKWQNKNHIFPYCTKRRKSSPNDSNISLQHFCFSTVIYAAEASKTYLKKEEKSFALIKAVFKVKNFLISFSKKKKSHKMSYFLKVKIRTILIWESTDLCQGFAIRKLPETLKKSIYLRGKYWP